MKNKDFAKLGKQLTANLPDSSVKGPLIVLCPMDQVLRGLYFESSSFGAETFFVYYFFLPLCVPTQHLYFNFGNRLRNSGGGDVWNAGDPGLLAALHRAISEQALPYLSRVTTLDNVVQMLNGSRQPRTPYKQQAIAYTLVRLGNFEKGELALKELILQLDNSIPWQRDMSRQAQDLLEQLKTNGAEAQEQLAFWEEQTKEDLKLTKVCH